jgi:hypothetical protein
MRSIDNGIEIMAQRKIPHPERDPEHGEGEQSKDATPAIQLARDVRSL